MELQELLYNTYGKMEEQAEKLQISRMTLHNWMKDRVKFRAKIERIAEDSGVDECELLKLMK